MAKNLATRRELLDQWRAIEDQEEDEEEEDDEEDDPSKRRRLHHRKEQWFADAFQHLISLPKETHIWCGAWDLMEPLLETFYNYYKDERDESPLRRLWRRISEETGHCVQCIIHHHQAQDMYNTEYESSSISPLLGVLQSLDEERITTHLKEINAKLVQENYEPACDNPNVISIMYEVLMFPQLLDDRSLFIEFEKFIEAIDNIHELALGAQQHFPGVYALFFFKRRVRLVGYRLAGSMGKVRGATDLEPLQPLIKKFIGFLETEVLPSAAKTSRPRAELDRISIWLGIKSLLGFLEPAAFEEGILERYPIFLDIVLNHITGDSADFSHAVTCLRQVFEMLGCKLWLRSTLSPSVMRNTLLGQCFHTRNEKSHKDIFDLFQPFLQSLEALQDGEHEKQRRHFLYFLLHQVPVSSNFSVLTRQKSRQIALLVVHRGYSMNPPCPPFECAHMWGPSLVLSLKDSSLHNSLRQPAFDLIEAIMVSDAAVLISSLLRCSPQPNTGRSMSREVNDDVRILSSLDGEEKASSSWKDFSVQSKIASVDFTDWMCIPMLWIDVLVDINPSNLPVSFSKAVFWARARFSMVESDISTELVVPVRTWLSSCEISAAFGWKVPTGSNDGGDEKDRKNSIKVSTMMLPLIRSFNRLTEYFLIQAELGELQKQWIWEPRMGESLILSLVDPNHSVRQFGKYILEHVSDTRGLACGLKFLCSSGSSLSAVLLGLKHAVKLVQMDTVVSKFQILQHFFFVLRKLLDRGELLSSDMPEKSRHDTSMTKFSSDGGFLRQPVFDSSTTSDERRSVEIDVKILEKFSWLLSEIAWPSIRRCLMEGKKFIGYSICQMTCVRLLEILPVVVESFYPFKQSSSFGMSERVIELSWMNDLADWGKSTLAVVVVYWKRTVGSLLKLLKGSCNSSVVSTIQTLEDLISCDNVAMDELVKHVSQLSVSLSKGASDNDKIKFSSEGPSLKMKEPALDAQPFATKDTNAQILDPAEMDDKNISFDFIILSDDENETSPNEKKQSDASQVLTSHADKITSGIEPMRKKTHGMGTLKYPLKTVKKADVADSFTSHVDSNNLTKKLASTSLAKSESVEKNQEKICIDNSLKSQARVNLKNSCTAPIIPKKSSKASESVALKTDDKLLKHIVSSGEDDPLEDALNSLRQQPPSLAKPSIPVLKRQLIQLQSPVQNKSGHLLRREARTRRFKPPRLDEWYKPILEIDYFATVGLASSNKDNHQPFEKLKEVPVCFQSPAEYIDIFRPLVLEEFKAQLENSVLERTSLEEMYFGVLSVLSAERVDDFHLVRFAHDDNDSTTGKSFSENDLVLLTKEPLQKSSHDIHVVGKVERRDRDNKGRLSILLIRFYLQNGIQRLNQARRNLLERSKWHASRIMSITPQLREFQALSSINDIPLLPTILKPVNDFSTSHECSKVDLRKLSQPLQQILKSSFNESQLQAISVAIGSSNPRKVELSLIQGPPGTGKTRTILAIASGLLASPLQKENQAPNSRHGRVEKNDKISETAAIARAWQDAALAKQLNEDLQRNPKPTDTSVRRRILICAQSNAAVDELVSRISSQGLYGSDGKIYTPYLVRVGNAKTVHPNSLPHFIDTLVDHRLGDEMMKFSNAKNDMNAPSLVTMRSNLEKLVDRIRFYEAKLANLSDGNSSLNKSLEDDIHKGDDLKEMSDSEVQMRLRKLYEQKKQLYKDISAAQAKERKTNEEMKGLKFKLRKSILREAEIVITTLSGCGGDLYGVCSESMPGQKFSSPSEHNLFDAVVIDEAAQALEPATLIPLQLLKSSGVKCIMVGDPKQLPATVLSNVASKFQFECSMFERLQKAGHPVVMLTKQYRMHPEICSFPSLHFYERKLLNGDMSSKSARFHETESLGPYVFNDIVDGRELRRNDSGAMSLYNEHEADAAVEIIRFFKNRYPSEYCPGRIGVITPYKCQLSLLRSRFSIAFGSSVIEDMEFNTVDGFQGREVDILILSTVRASETNSVATGMRSSNIGFVADVRRMNVALTRARLSLWVVGNARTLQSNKNWAALIKDARERNLVRAIKMPYRSMFRGASINDHSTEPKFIEKVEDSRRHVKQHARSSEGNVSRRTDRTGDGAKHRDRGSKHSSTRDESGFSKSNVVDKDNSGVAVETVDKKTSEKHIARGRSLGDEGNGKKGKSENPHSSKRKAQFEDLGKSVKHRERDRDWRLQEPKRLKMVSEHDVSQRNLEERGPNNGDTVRGGTPDLIAKRKKQREDVAAILDSALISSKKSGASAKPKHSKPNQERKD